MVAEAPKGSNLGYRRQDLGTFHGSPRGIQNCKTEISKRYKYGEIALVKFGLVSDLPNYSKDVFLDDTEMVFKPLSYWNDS